MVAIKTTQWGGQNGHLALVLYNTAYHTSSGHRTTLPGGTTNNTNGQNQPPLIPAGLINNMTNSNRTDIQGQHERKSIEYWTQDAVDEFSVERIVQDVINPMYVEELDEYYFGYINQTIKTILKRIKNNWCVITTLEKKQVAENFRVQ